MFLTFGGFSILSREKINTFSFKLILHLNLPSALFIIKLNLARIS